MTKRFAEVVHTHYVSKGMSASTAVALLHVRTGVSIHSLWKAIRGFRVAPETAITLREWALVAHGIEDLDVEALLMAPVKGRRAEGHGT